VTILCRLSSFVFIERGRGRFEAGDEGLAVVDRGSRVTVKLGTFNAIEEGHVTL
jgi:hypothetical protein